MKVKNQFLYALLIIIVAFSASCKPKNWAAEIDGKYITIKEFYDLYYTQNKMILGKSKKEIDKLAKNVKALRPMLRQFLDKEQFLEFIINRKLIYNKAIKDKSIDQSELNAVLTLYKMQQLMTYFLKEKLQDQIKITDDEVSAFYTKNRKRFANVPLDDRVVERIKLHIQMKKLEAKSMEYVKKLIEQSKIDKSGFKAYMKDNKKKDGWAVKIDSDTISIKDFNMYYYTQHKITYNLPKKEIDKLAAKSKDHPTLSKSNYLESLIRAHLVYKKAMKDMKPDEMKTVMELVNLQAVPSYYISEILKDKVKTNADEIKKFYDKYSATRLLRGKPFNDKTKQYIKSRLIRRKFEMESQRFVLQLKEESKINSEGFRKHLKESAKIKKDSSSKKKDSKSDKKDSMKTKKK